jgi:hypothetical protein
MAGLLRAAASAVRNGLASSGGGASARAAAQQQQRRGAHELHAHTNKHVESWLSRREDMETEFKWDKATTRAVLLGAFLIPIATYNALCYMAHQGGWAARLRGAPTPAPGCMRAGTQAAARAGRAPTRVGCAAAAPAECAATTNPPATRPRLDPAPPCRR